MITLYKNINILICLAMKAIDQIVGFKAQRVKVPKTISSGYNLTLIVSQASSPQYFNTYKLFLQPVIFLKAGSTTNNISTYGLLWSMSYQQKIKHLGKLIQGTKPELKVREGGFTVSYVQWFRLSTSLLLSSIAASCLNFFKVSDCLF